MKIHTYLRSFLFPRLLKAGSQVADISLTSQDGTWVQSTDYLDNMRVLWVSCKDVRDSNSQRWLRSFARALDKIESQNCKLFLLSSQSLEDIREMHRQIDLESHALYDPMALESRKLGLAGRRPMCRDAVLLVNEKGSVIESKCGQSDVEYWLGKLGVQSNKEDSTTQTSPILTLNATETEILMEQGGVLIDVRTFPEYEPDHVPGALHIPVDELPQRYSEIGQQSRLIFICQAGGRAYSAAEFMSSIGCTDVYVVTGGMSSWTGTRNTAGIVE